MSLTDAHPSTGGPDGAGLPGRLLLIAGARVAGSGEAGAAGGSMLLPEYGDAPGSANGDYTGNKPQCNKGNIPPSIAWGAMG